MEASIGHVTSNDGTRIGYEQTGSGPPLLLVHGSTADHTRWAPVLPALNERFTVYAMDRRGRGLSGDTAPYSLDREYEDVAAVANSIPGPVDIVAHSHGALCTLEATRHISNQRRLVLYEPPMHIAGHPMYQAGFGERLTEMVERGEHEEVVITFFRELLGLSDADLAMMRAAPAWASRIAAAHTIPREFTHADYEFDPGRFEHLRDVPVLLLTGGESPEFLQPMTARMHEGLPASRVAIMPGQGHIAMNTAPDLFLRLVLDFLDE